jgi:hypothetical protein
MAWQLLYGAKGLGNSKEGKQMSQPRRSFRLLHAALLAGLLSTAAATCPAADSGADERPPARWWIGFQPGLVAVVAQPDPAAGSGGLRMRYGIEGGVRIARHWRLGLQIDGGSLGKASCPPGDLFCDSMKQEISHHYLTLIANPGGGYWLYQLSAGRAIFDLLENNVAFDDGYTFVEDASGWGVRLSMGHDWHRKGARTHLGWRASLERANPGRLSGNFGSTAHTTISLSVGVSWY